MRPSYIVATLSLFALAACSSAPTAPSTPVQANQAQAATAQPAAQGDAAQAQQPRARRKYMNTGSRLATESPDADPSLGMPASGLSNTTTNTSGGGPK